MAKKGQVVQLQTEVNTEEEWDKLLARDGLIIIDVYSDWCGPCSAMQANLKKLKLEMGGDFLQLAMAKSDNIEALSRFRNKSEPTWMFIAKGQMVQLLFGANAPELQALIIKEMKFERDCLEGNRQRVNRQPNEFSEQEQKLFDEGIRKEIEKEKMIAEKIAKQKTDRKVAQAKNILETMSNMGVLMVFPHAIRKAPDIMDDFWPDTGLHINKKDRVAVSPEAMEDIEYFSNYKLSDATKENLFSDKALVMLITHEDGNAAPMQIDEAARTFVYGPMKSPPGSPESLASQLMQISEAEERRLAREAREKSIAAAIIAETAKVDPKEAEGGEEEEDGSEEDEDEGVEEDEPPPPTDLPAVEKIEEVVEEEQEPEETVAEEEEIEKELAQGIWAPANDLVKATALKYLFPLMTSTLILPEPKPIPPHVAVAFDIFKKDDVMKLINEFEADVMAYGFFTDQDCDVARLVAKTSSAMEKRASPDGGEKLVLKVSKKRSDPVLAFAQLGPTYMSSNVVEGEKECAKFFPEGWTQDEEEVEVQGKTKKKKKTASAHFLKPVDQSEEDVVHVSGSGTAVMPEPEVVTMVQVDAGDESEDSPREDVAPQTEDGEMSELPGVELEEGEDAEGEEGEEGGADKATSPPPQDEVAAVQKSSSRVSAAARKRSRLSKPPSGEENQPGEEKPPGEVETVPLAEGDVPPQPTEDSQPEGEAAAEAAPPGGEEIPTVATAEELPAAALEETPAVGGGEEATPPAEEALPAVE